MYKNVLKCGGNILNIKLGLCFLLLFSSVSIKAKSLSSWAEIYGMGNFSIKSFEDKTNYFDLGNTIGDTSDKSSGISGSLDGTYFGVRGQNYIKKYNAYAYYKVQFSGYSPSSLTEQKFLEVGLDTLFAGFKNKYGNFSVGKLNTAAALVDLNDYFKTSEARDASFLNSGACIDNSCRVNGNYRIMNAVSYGTPAFYKDKIKFFVSYGAEVVNGGIFSSRNPVDYDDTPNASVVSFSGSIGSRYKGLYLSFSQQCVSFNSIRIAIDTNSYTNINGSYQIDIADFNIQYANAIMKLPYIIGLSVTMSKDNSQQLENYYYDKNTTQLTALLKQNNKFSYKMKYANNAATFDDADGNDKFISSSTSIGIGVDYKYSDVVSIYSEIASKTSVAFTKNADMSTISLGLLLDM